MVGVVMTIQNWVHATFRLCILLIGRSEGALKNGVNILACTVHMHVPDHVLARNRKVKRQMLHAAASAKGEY